MITQRVSRRNFVGMAGAAAGSSLYGAKAEVKRVVVMFKCHFDLGFIDTQAAVMDLYFKRHFPQAITIARSMRDAGDTPYVWTTGSWLLYEYLEQATAAERVRMEKAIADGDIAWHALPFSWQTELLDRSLISAMLGLSKALDQRFGRVTTGAKMTDVPGHSRGLIGPLTEGGVRFLDIGVNSASTAPQVPSLFVWRDGDGASLLVMYHRTDYGGVVQIPGSDLAIAVEVKDDNKGPHTAEEIRAIYQRLRGMYPKAAIRAANLSEIAEALTPFRHGLPVVTQEIGDTWIYGVASDPVKMARYRELVRLRREWLHAGKLQVGNTTDLAFCSKLCLAAEHTWGTDTKTWLDFDTYPPEALAAKLYDPRYRTVENSWVEKRENVTAAVKTLPAELRTEAEARIGALVPVMPDVHAVAVSSTLEPHEAKHFTVLLDKQTGAVVQLTSKSSGYNWASVDHPLALFSYQTLSKKDYDQFLAAYITVRTDWAPKDFGKPNLEQYGAQSRTFYPGLIRDSFRKEEGRCVVDGALAFEGDGASGYGTIAWPQKLCLRLVMPDAEPVVQLELYWSGKPATRMPEVLWLTFQPKVPDGGQWVLDKVERPVSPLDVVAGGNRHMHAIGRGVTYQGVKNGLMIESLDAPLIALGERSPIAFSNTQPDLASGIHFCLFNNAWGTNYVQWFGEDMKFRFRFRELV